MEIVKPPDDARFDGRGITETGQFRLLLSLATIGPDIQL